jgi:hypothetical protein
MKSFVASLAAVLLIAVAVGFILEGSFQTQSYAAFATEGARVGSPGDNLVNY